MDFVKNSPPLNVYSSQQARQLDTIAIEQQGIKGYELMCRAGQAAYNVITNKFPSARRILIIAGGGNNAGDGYVLARLLDSTEYNCAVIPIMSPDKLQGDALHACSEFLDQGGELYKHEGELPHCDLIVDAIFGIGLNRLIEGEVVNVITQINQHSAPTLALDIPSGLNSDTGIPMDISVCANTTITFIGLKSGLLTGQACDNTGEVIVHDLELPNTVFSQIEPIGNTLSPTTHKALLPRRKPSSHKNNFGHVLVIGGNIGYPNAAALAAIGAARSGAGLVSVVTHPDNVNAIASSCSSIMVRGIHQPSDMGNLINLADVIVLGPGLGKDAWARRFFARFIDIKKPVVVDADALTLLSHNPNQRDHWILTPHPGEAARLLACEKTEIEFNRLAAVKAIQEKYHGVIVLKGAGTLIYKDSMGFCINGNAALATGGTGDVLAGIIGSFIAQGLTPIDAAECATTIHGLAAERISQFGTRGLLASDLFPELIKLVNPCQNS
ncbi:MAG: NAD(P)H-hydrate dehydratase [Pseudomonadota bacterium]